MKNATHAVRRWWRERSDASLRAARGWSRTTVRRRSAAIAFGGVLMLALVITQALVSLAGVQEAQVSVARMVAAQSAHQDADMQHDALHANVLQAALVGRGGSGEPARIRNATGANADRMRRDLARSDRLDLPEAAREALASVRADLEAYTALAEQQVDELLDDPSTDAAGLPRFERLARRGPRAADGRGHPAAGGGPPNRRRGGVAQASHRPDAAGDRLGRRPAGLRPARLAPAPAR